MSPYAISLMSVLYDIMLCTEVTKITREGFLRKNIVAVSFFQNCAIHQYF